jgi:DNA-binding winged helix-turn-helix (wHTH) protein
LQTRQIFKFGPFGLESKTCLLLKDGEPVRLTRKSTETLLVLIQHSPNVVSKEDLLAAVWPDQFVDDHNLTQSISAARRALGVAEGLPGFIETFPGRGYRILGPVSVCQEVEPNGAPAAAGELEPDATEAAPSLGAAGTPAKTHSPDGSWRGRRILLLSLVTACIALAVFALVIFLRRPALERSEAPRIVPLSRQGGRQYQPVVSPDGKTVAFLWQKEIADQPRIWLQNLHESTSRPLTQKEGEYSGPAWSPDGRSIACLRFRENSAELVTIELAGGNEHLLSQVLPTRFGLPHRHLDWSPDGEWIAVDDAPSLGDPLAGQCPDRQPDATYPARRSDRGRRCAPILAGWPVHLLHPRAASCLPGPLRGSEARRRRSGDRCLEPRDQRSVVAAESANAGLRQQSQRRIPHLEDPASSAQGTGRRGRHGGLR